MADGKVFVGDTSTAVKVYANAPVFWGQNYGYQWTPIGDWAKGYYKGECEPGKAITGLSAYQASWNPLRQAHAVMCSDWVNTTPASCQAYGFGLPASSWDWDPNFDKAECPSNQYVAGISQGSGSNGTQAGVFHSVLCCPDTSPGNLTVSQSNCSLETLYGANSQDYSGPDWDNHYYKAQCPVGEVAAGVSSLHSSSQGPVGAPHAILCRKP